VRQAAHVLMESFDTYAFAHPPPFHDQATALKADAKDALTRALSISGLSTCVCHTTATLSFAQCSPPKPRVNPPPRPLRDAAAPAGRSPATQQTGRVLPPLPKVQVTGRLGTPQRLPSLVPIRADAAPAAPQRPLAPVAEVAAAPRGRNVQDRYSDDGSDHSGSGSDYSSSYSSDVSYDEESGVGSPPPPPPSQQQQQQRPRAPQRGASAPRSTPRSGSTPKHASTRGTPTSNGRVSNGFARPNGAAAVAANEEAEESSDGDGDGRNVELSQRIMPPPTRGTAAMQFARSMSSRAVASFRSNARSGARSPYTQGVKHVLNASLVRAAFGALCMDLLFGVLGTMLTVFVPQLCQPTTRVVVTPQLVIPASTAIHLCGIVEQIAYPRMATLHKAAFLVNIATLISLFFAELVFLWREFSIVDLCDEDRAAAWTNLSAQLSAFPNLGERLDRLNGAAHVAAGCVLALLVGNWALSAALALQVSQFADYRTPVVLVALATPSARRVASFFATAEESKRKRLALPLWAWGLVSLNCLDERWMRTGEDAQLRMQPRKRQQTQAKPQARRQRK
jgi:hypothetical protein